MTHREKRLRSWLKDALKTVARGESDHIHADELLAKRFKDPDAVLRAMRQPFAETIELLGTRISDVMPMLVIPLEVSERFTRRRPTRATLAEQMSSEPPSIYVRPRRMDTLCLGEWYRISLPQFELFDEPRDDVVLFYQIARGELERKWRWEYTRSILGEHYLPAQKTGYYSESGESPLPNGPRSRRR